MTFHTNAGNWIRDGDTLTTPEGYVQILYQSFAAWLAFHARHAPESVELQLDLDKLRECFSVKGGDGNRVIPTTWELRPEPQLLEQRRAAIAAWTAHTKKYSASIPYVAFKRLNNPASDDDKGMFNLSTCATAANCHIC